MRDQVIDVVGQISNILPRWMLSRQTNGRVLGFTPAWVIAYTDPGQSGQIAYNIETQFNSQLNLIDFKVDRYELDNFLTKNWDRAAQHWIPQPPELETFDVNSHYQLPTPNDSSLIFNGGTGYRGVERAQNGDIVYTGDRILISGSQVGGLDVVNNIILTVNTVDELGTIQSAFCYGFAPSNTAGVFYYNIVGTNITGTGTGATWDIETVPGVATVFDGNSLQFTAPVDMYTNNNTTEYDKYLLFPKYNIIDSVPQTS
jgi:hypothetical protein